MDYNNRLSQDPRYGPVYRNDFYQNDAPHHHHNIPNQFVTQPRIEVVVPSHHFQPHHQPSPQPQFYQTLPSQTYYPPPPPNHFRFDHQYIPVPPAQYFANENQHLTNGHVMMQHPPSSPDPLHNGYSTQSDQKPSIRQLPQEFKPEPEPEPDYAVLLLSLADEYFEAAKKLKIRSEEYYKLIATGLGCLESVLTNVHLEPLQEAQVSLRYAQTLFDETENNDDAERTLTKAIEVCDRNKFIDLKYSLQLLLSCVLFRSKPKAAIKDLQTLLDEAEVYQHAAWSYALRYQLIVFSLSTTSGRDLQQAIHHSERLAQTSRRHGDKAVTMMASIVEAVLHLHTAHPEAVLSAQRAIATARSLTADPSVPQVIQLAFLIELIDLCCSIRENNIEQGDQKRKRVHEIFGTMLDDKSWQKDSALVSLPVSSNSLRGLEVQKGGLIQRQAGQYSLQFSWLPLEQVEAVGFLLSAASKARKNASDRNKVQQFIDEGLNLTRAHIKGHGRSTAAEDASSTARARSLETHFHIEQAFLHCSSGNWKDARSTVRTLTKALNTLEIAPPNSAVCITQYLHGVIEQGEGNLDAAFRIYQSPNLSLSQFQRSDTNGIQTYSSSKIDAETDSCRKIAILAAMNTLLIIKDPRHPSHAMRTSLIDTLNTTIKSVQDKNITAAYTLIHQQVSDRGMVVSKNQLVSALNLAKQIANTQITALVLVVMQQEFFRGLTDEHANKCVRAAVMNVKNWGDGTWGYIAGELEKESLEFRGDGAGVERLAQEMEARLQHVPEGVRKRMAEE